VALPTRGKLWTWTLQRFMPKPPYRSIEGLFVPFAVGYVELPGALRIEARLAADDASKLAIGADMELEFYTQYVDNDGTAVINYSFRVA
jgi:uncharacterized protein